MRNNQNSPSKQFELDKVNGRQLPSSSTVLSNHISKTPNRPSKRYHSNDREVKRLIVILEE